MSKVCQHCLREKAETPEQKMSAEFCNEDSYGEDVGDVTCDLIFEKNLAIAALRSVLKSQDKATILTAARILEDITGPTTACPKCDYPGVVVKGYVKIHFANFEASRPCAASFKNVVGGILL